MMKSTYKEEKVEHAENELCQLRAAVHDCVNVLDRSCSLYHQHQLLSTLSSHELITSMLLLLLVQMFEC